MKYFVEIPEVYKALVEIESLKTLDRDTILRLAEDKFDEEGSDTLEYSYTLDLDEWFIIDSEGNHI